jgi:hypothetical protein
VDGQLRILVELVWKRCYNSLEVLVLLFLSLRSSSESETVSSSHVEFSKSSLAYKLFPKKKLHLVRVRHVSNSRPDDRTCCGDPNAYQ